MTDRKKDHINLALKAQVKSCKTLSGVHYEPLWTAHDEEIDYQVSFSFGKVKKRLKIPFWISSMTGGEKRAQKINQDLACLGEKYGLGMGLGSCRVYLEGKRKEDFKMRSFAPRLPLLANLGIAQVESYLENGQWSEVEKMLGELEVDGLMVHINPLQEWLQPEGDRYQYSPFETLIKLKEVYDGVLGVKEVGQGFGPKSLKALIDMNVHIIELAGHGGTNFTYLEKLRQKDQKPYDHFTKGFEMIGHHWSEMVTWLNELYNEKKDFPLVIISGGIRTPLEAALAMKQAQFTSIIGLGYPFLKWQQQGQYELEKSFQTFYKHWDMAMKSLTVKK